MQGHVKSWVKIVMNLRVDFFSGNWKGLCREATGADIEPLCQGCRTPWKIALPLSAHS